MEVNPDKLKLKDALELLDASINNVLAYFDKLDLGNLPEALQAFGQLKDNKEILDRLHKTIHSLYDKLSTEDLPNALQPNKLDPKKIDSIRVGGKLFTVATRINASIPEYKRDAGNAWIRDVAKVPELVVPRVNPKQLSSFVKGYFEANAMWPPEEVMTIHIEDYMQVRKS